MITSTEISGKTFTVTCAEPLSPQADWLIGLLRRIEADRGPGFLKDGVRIQVGWSMLVVVEQKDGYLICEPNYAGDPFHEKNDDLTITLSVQSEQNTLLSQLCLGEGTPVSFQDKVVFAKDCFDKRQLILERKALSAGDSGWYIGPGGESNDSLQYEAVFVYQLLQLRPALLKVLTLPVGHLVVFDGDEIKAILNAQNETLEI